jgi:hypothetical protein
MNILILPDGNARCIYGESMSLSQLGKISIRRGSHVEPDEDGQWYADLSPVNGPKLGPFETRTEALAAEVRWLTENWLNEKGHYSPSV